MTAPLRTDVLHPRGAAIHFADLTLGYDRHPAVHHLSADIDAGAMVAIVGPNGAGKSTLLKSLAGALAPLSGIQRIEGAARGAIAYLPQLAAIDRTFPICVYDLVATGLWRRTGLFGGVSRTDRVAVAQALAHVGLTGFERRTIDALSGGQMQRALFARLMLQDADVILLDEPLTAVDTKTAADLLEILRGWHAERRTILAVLHDMTLVRELFPQTLLLARERVAFGATADVLTPANLQKARHMIEAFDEAAHICEQDRAAAQ
jgi:zinc/manganese transport system ATP-binding protein